MADKSDLQIWVLESLRFLGGTGSVIEVCKHVWQVHEADLRASGDLFYLWQYDIRWAAQALRDRGLLERVDGDRNQPWTLTTAGWRDE